jgi:hypothetical protein
MELTVLHFLLAGIIQLINSRQLTEPICLDVALNDVYLKNDQILLLVQSMEHVTSAEFTGEGSRSTKYIKVSLENGISFVLEVSPFMVDIRCVGY